MSVSSIPCFCFFDLGLPFARGAVFRVRFLLGGASGIGRSEKRESSSDVLTVAFPEADAVRRLSSAGAGTSESGIETSERAGMVCSKKRDDHENAKNAALEAIDRYRKTLAQSGRDGIRT